MDDKNNILNKLKKEKKTQLFDVPENYFEEFSDNLMAKINKQQKEPEKRFEIKMLKPYITVAAAFVLVFFGWSILISKMQTNSTVADNVKPKVDAVVEEIPVEINEYALTEFVLENDAEIFEDFSAEDFEDEDIPVFQADDYYSNSDLVAMNTDSTEYIDPIDSLSEAEQEEIIEYLSYADIDLEYYEDYY